MSDYKFTGEVPTVMTGLVQGVNAVVSGDSASPYGSTIVCLPGDTLHTDAPYGSAWLAAVDDTPETPPSDEPPEDVPTTEQEPTE